jgi:hypothetical protein
VDAATSHAAGTRECVWYRRYSSQVLTALNLAIAAILLGFVLRRSTSVMVAFGFAFISARALGNAVDRLRLSIAKLWLNPRERAPLKSRGDNPA